MPEDESEARIPIVEERARIDKVIAVQHAVNGTENNVRQHA